MTTNILQCSYLPNENVRCSVERLCWGGCETESEETTDVANNELHETHVVHHGDERGEKHNHGQNLNKTTES
jgi:hypothetical protein